MAFNNTLFIDLKFARIVVPRLDRGVVKKDSPFHANARCPVCGDSRTSKTKARFHIREWKGTVVCSCFNCGYSAHLSRFLKDEFPDIFADYKFEKYRSASTDAPVVTDYTQNAIKPTLNALRTFDLPLVSSMVESPVYGYVKRRHLPDYPFYYAHEFIKFSKQFNEDLDGGVEGPRLIIPFFNKKGEIYAYQGRDLTGKSTRKYITVNVDKRMPTIFGISRIDISKPIVIVEGPLDSLFLNNALAAVNAGVLSTAKKIESAISKDNITLCLDNEPRNKEIVKLYEAAIDEGYKIVIWPDKVSGVKDINDMVIKGLNPDKIIKENTYVGLMAKLAFSKWRKI